MHTSFAVTLFNGSLYSLFPLPKGKHTKRCVLLNEAYDCSRPVKYICDGFPVYFITRLFCGFLFSATNEYVLCLFTATSLGCSIEAAKIYTDLVNQTLATLLANTGYSCHIANPLDVIKLLTTTTSTTTATTTISHMSRGPHGFLTTTLTNAYEAHNTGARYSPFKIVIIVLVVQRWLKVYFTLSRT